MINICKTYENIWGDITMTQENENENENINVIDNANENKNESSLSNKVRQTSNYMNKVNYIIKACEFFLKISLK